MRVLLIEDDRMVADALRRALGGAGLEVDWARDGEEGEAALRDATHALVLLDLGLPLRDGFDLLAALRRRGTGAADGAERPRRSRKPGARA